MAMLESVWNQKRPTSLEIKKMWEELQINFEPIKNQAIDKLLENLRKTHVNGGAEFVCFRLEENTTFHWFGSRNRLDEINFFDRFLNLPIVVESFSVIQFGKSKVSNTNFEWASSFTFDGELAQALVQGGAYHKFDGSDYEAKQIGANFCESLFGHRFSDIQMYKTHESFTEWFHNIAWDVTWLGFDKLEIKVWLLCVTDTD
jgi:hypothetical protein